MEHKFAALLRLAADNKDQLFECDEMPIKCLIATVLNHTRYNWQPVLTEQASCETPEQKKIKRWLWADKDGFTTGSMHTEEEIKTLNDTYTIKLLWSETEFEVNDE